MKETYRDKLVRLRIKLRDTIKDLEKSENNFLKDKNYLKAYNIKIKKEITTKHLEDINRILK